MKPIPYTPRIFSTILFLSLAACAQNTPATGLARLRSNIEQITSSTGTHWGIYIKCLDTNEEIAINADEPMDTMSVIKVPLIVGINRSEEHTSELQSHS